jgi:hypothetical protein
MVSAALCWYRSMLRDLQRDRLSESQSPGNLLRTCRMAASSRGRRSSYAGSVLTRHFPYMGGGDNLAGEVFGVEDGSGNGGQKE